MSAYNIRPEYQSFDQPPLDGTMEDLQSISDEFEQSQQEHEWKEKTVVTNHTITTSDGFSLDILEVYPKVYRREETSLPAIIYCHGGGFFSAHSLGQLRIMERYAHLVDCKVFLIVYRKSILNPFPTGFNDCFEGFDWIHRNSASLHVDHSRLVLLGDSAGGCLAAGVVQKIRDLEITELAGQVLIYPALDHKCSTASATLFKDVPVWNANNNKIMWDVYLRKYGGANTKHAPLYASPSHHPNLEKLPPTYIETAEFDAVRDEAVAYAKSLQDNGNKVKLNNTKGTIHAFDFVEAAFTDQIIELRAKVILEMIANAGSPTVANMSA